MSFVRTGVSAKLKAVDPGKANLRITAASLFNDDLWKFETFTTGKPRNTIRWNFELSDGSLLTDRKNRAWCRAAKVFLLMLINGELTTGNEIRSTTILFYFAQLKRFMLWMSSKELNSFADINKKRLLSYRNRLRRDVREGKITAKYRHHSLSIVKMLVAARNHLPSPIQVTPLEFNEVCGRDVAITPQMRIGTTATMPDEVFTKILNASVEWIKDVAPGIFEISDELDSYRETWEFSSRKNYREFYKTKAQLPTDERSFPCSGVTLSMNATKMRDLTKLLNHLVTACHFVIAGMTGQRISETLSIRRGCLKQRKLRDDRVLLEIHGTLFKTATDKKGEPAFWIAGWDSPDNPVRLAVQVLERLTSRRAVPEPDALLFTPYSERRNLENPGLCINAVMYRMAQYLKLIGITNWHVTSHQLRKNFARLVVFQFPTAVFAVARQFQHVSAQMMSRYLPSDLSIISDIMDAAYEIGMERLDGILSSEILGGRKGQEILTRNEPYRGESGAAARKELIRELINDPSVRIWVHVYGVCIFEERRSSCGGNIANVGLETCVGCANFATDESHAPFWREMEDVATRNVAEYRDLGLPTVDAERQLANASAMRKALKATPVRRRS